jgi:hypothetical protein
VTRGVEGRDVERGPDDGSPATDRSPSRTCSAVARDRGQSRQSRDPTAIASAELRQLGDQRYSDDLSNGLASEVVSRMWWEFPVGGLRAG